MYGEVVEANKDSFNLCNATIEIKVYVATPQNSLI